MRLRSAVLVLLAALLSASLAAGSAAAQGLDAADAASLVETIAGSDEMAARTAFDTALSATTRAEDRDDILVARAAFEARLENHAEAARLWLEIAAQRAERLGPQSPERAAALEAAGDAFWRAGDTAAAIAAHSDAIRTDLMRGLALDAIPLHAALAERIEAIAQPRLRLRYRAEIEALTPFSASLGDATAPADARPAHSLVRIFYATDRARTDSERPSEIYGSERGELDYGWADVSIPLVHKPGALEAPTVWTFEAEDLTRHVVLKSVTPAVSADMFAQMQNHLEITGSNEAFVFVHGFNVTFADAARRTAQMAYDMNFEGLPILYSWPSQGSLFAYLADAAVVQLSARRLSGFLDQVVADTGATRIHLIAHSMGNRALVEALELFALRNADKPPAFDQVLFTAPDVDAGLFAEMAETIRPAVRRMTLYTSQKDWALMASRKLHGDAPRAGEGGPGTPIPAWVDSIDMSTLGEDMLAHSYFANDASALTDILTLFWRDSPPERRCGIGPGSPAATAAAWLYDPTHCDGSAMLSALAQLRSARVSSLSEALSLIESRFAPPELEPEKITELETAVSQILGD
ncbi:Esterase/lipase superfamily enzyme [Devosia enhydra]|uniref:Esterase/lipase superfamily enzyme n=1 Tax=Devosia enhydra TaxID=665118 RepID=A0A1K2I3N3_9HYPH|nr:alpha/beta hydrolase [Devosia enhydra]SFZ86839.1 Esterase/lipase superfamily enzyme [Devosia enhydra]